MKDKDTLSSRPFAEAIAQMKAYASQEQIVEIYDPLKPIRISNADIKAMSDEQLVAALGEEDGRKGLMTAALLARLMTEINARNLSRATRPHWSVLPTFVAAIISAAAACLALWL